MTWELGWHPFRAEWVLFTSQGRPALARHGPGGDRAARPCRKCAGQARDRPAAYGARSSGGGTVVVLCRLGALDDIDGIIR